jgi:hypothetical protein
MMGRLVGLEGFKKLQLVLAVVLSVSGLAPTAHAGSAECFAAHEKSQVLRMESKLMEAREVLKECSLAACPSLVRGDCVQWLAEVQRAIPSVIFTAQADGEDVVDVTITYKGDAITDTLDGRAMEFKPGAHAFSFKHGEFDAIERTVVLREGEKNRVVLVEFKTPQKEQPLTAQPGYVPGAPPEPRGTRPVPVLTYVFGGAAVIALGVSGVFTFTALADKDKAKKDCNALCPDSVVDPIREKASVATYTGLAGGVLAITATVFYLARPTVYEDEDIEDTGTDDEARLPTVDVVTSSDLVYLNLRGSF